MSVGKKLIADVLDGRRKQQLQPSDKTPDEAQDDPDKKSRVMDSHDVQIIRLQAWGYGSERVLLFDVNYCSFRERLDEGLNSSPRFGWSGKVSIHLRLNLVPQGARTHIPPASLEPACGDTVHGKTFQLTPLDQERPKMLGVKSTAFRVKQGSGLVFKRIAPTRKSPVLRIRGEHCSVVGVSAGDKALSWQVPRGARDAFHPAQRIPNTIPSNFASDTATLDAWGWALRPGPSVWLSFPLEKTRCPQRGRQTHGRTNTTERRAGRHAHADGWTQIEAGRRTETDRQTETGRQIRWRGRHRQPGAPENTSQIGKQVQLDELEVALLPNFQRDASRHATFIRGN